MWILLPTLWVWSLQRCSTNLKLSQLSVILTTATNRKGQSSPYFMHKGYDLLQVFLLICICLNSYSFGNSRFHLRKNNVSSCFLKKGCNARLCICQSKDGLKCLLLCSNNTKVEFHSCVQQLRIFMDYHTRFEVRTR